MRIELSQSGGIAYFPGLSKPTVIDVDDLDEATRDKLEHLIQAARFFELPPNVGTPAKGAADYQYQTLTVEREGQRHTVRILVPIEPPALNEFVQFIKQLKK